MSADLLRTPTPPSTLDGPLASSFAPVSSPANTQDNHQNNPYINPHINLTYSTSRPSFPRDPSSPSSYSVLSVPTTLVGRVSDTPHLGPTRSINSESEPHFPGAWVDTAPSTPAPLKDNQDILAQHIKNINLTGQQQPRETLPATPVAQHLHVASPTEQLAEDLQPESTEPTSTTVVNNTVPEFLDPSTSPSAHRAPAQPLRADVNPASVKLATDEQPSSLQRSSRPLEQVVGSTLSPDEQVQQGAKQVGQKALDSYVVPVVPVIATLSQHEHSNVTATPSPQPIPSVLANATHQPDDAHQHLGWSSRASKSSAIQQKAKELTTAVPGAVAREKGAPEAPPTTQAPWSAPSKSTAFASSPGNTNSNTSSSPHSAYPHLPPSEGEGLDELSTRAVGGDTSVTSLSTSVGNTESINNPNRKAVAGVEHAPRPIFSEEHSRALGAHRGRDAALAAGANAGGAAVAVVAAKERDKKEMKHVQHSTSPVTPKSGRFSSIRKLTKGRRYSHSSNRGEDIGPGCALTDSPIGAAFPESTYVIEDDTGAPQDLTRDPLLVPLPVSHHNSGISGLTPAVATGSPEHKQHRLTKKHSPSAGAPPRVSDSSIPTFPQTVDTSTGLRPGVDTKSAHPHQAPDGASETGHFTLVNGHHTGATKPKLMDRIKGEVKIMQGTLKGDEMKKMEGRVLKEFGSS